MHLWNESCHQGTDGILNFDIFPLISIAFCRLTKAINRTGDYRQTSLSGVVFKLASEHLIRLGKTQLIDPSFKKVKFFLIFKNTEIQLMYRLPRWHSLVVKNLPANEGDIRYVGSIPGSGKVPGAGHVNPLQYSCLENAMDRGAWRATVPRVAKSQRWLKRLSTCMHSWFTVLFISALQQSDSIIHVYKHFFHFLFHYGSSQDIEHSSSCCTVGPCCSFILHIIACIF